MPRPAATLLTVSAVVVSALVVLSPSAEARPHPGGVGCLGVARWIPQTFTNHGQTAYEVELANACSGGVWYKACHLAADGKYRRDSGYVAGRASRRTYVLVSGRSTPGSFEWNEGARSDAVSYPAECAARS